MTGRQFRLDRGGTFTDVVARRPDGRLLTHKPLSDSPARHADAAVEGVRTPLVITRGFRDALRIAYQNRPSIFARRIELPELLYERVVAVDERIAGADDGFPGAPVVQTHITNSRLTDPEVLEWRLPVRPEEFAVRRGNGGAGRWRGALGANFVIQTPGGGGYDPPSPDPHQAGEEIDDLRAF
ncbi:hydantoinase/oxoprolinase N-terminal domain-containing protein [Streptomyces coeruleorubidus]|uniref:hydantoinase/oxoprolinase N-terminal domain-containing protein n=1 Tax=Streptomyces coeruleorubidus TaxID=116188 RepID=UPI0036679F3E